MLARKQIPPVESIVIILATFTRITNYRVCNLHIAPTFYTSDAHRQKRQKYEQISQCYIIIVIKTMSHMAGDTGCGSDCTSSWSLLTFYF